MHEHRADVQSAALVMVMLLIFPLALTLTAFLMWIIVSLNGEPAILMGNGKQADAQARSCSCRRTSNG
jgi:hypothetical protein